MNKQIEETSKLTYDDRRKELTQEKSQVMENKTDTIADETGAAPEPKLISTVNQSMKVVYTEEGIKLAYKNLSNQKNTMEKRVADMKEKVETMQELSPELKQLKDNLDKISKYAQTEKLKFEYENMQKELKIVNKELIDIKDKIGSRLKL